MKKFFVLLVVLLAPVVWAGQDAEAEAEQPMCQDLVKHMLKMQNFSRPVRIEATEHFAQLHMRACGVQCDEGSVKSDIGGNYPRRTQHCKAPQELGIADFKYVSGKRSLLDNYPHRFMMQVGEIRYLIGCGFKKNKIWLDTWCYSRVRH